MIGMSFLSFLLLLRIGVIVAVVLHYGVRPRSLEGLDAVFAKTAVAWPGAWLGSPLPGHGSCRFQNVYLVPAVPGFLAAVLPNVVAWKSLEKIMKGRLVTGKGTPAMPTAAWPLAASD